LLLQNRLSNNVGSVKHLRAHYSKHAEKSAISLSDELSIWTPTTPSSTWVLGLLLRKTGCYELAITEGGKGVKLSGGTPVMRAALAHTLGVAGRTKEAFQILDDLTKLAKFLRG